ncbi:hypothetical protein AB0L83_31860 [Streptomyces sp. NPDC052071]|nr:MULTISPECIES: hypothetical protein [Streptomyces]MCY1655579.1 hypothetical protein [Streptomyces sp. SL203]MCY1676942.1 hypothetical protein [Streptomyces sp. SL294]WJY35476.1 hypothetical protein QTO28_32575 [Streptomyces sp. P9-2B-1]
MPASLRERSERRVARLLLTATPAGQESSSTSYRSPGSRIC